MKIRRNIRIMAGVVAAAIVVVAAVVILSGPATGQNPDNPNDNAVGLLDSNGDSLMVCISDRTNSMEQRAVQEMEVALNELQDHPRWAANYASVDTAVTTCPSDLSYIEAQGEGDLTDPASRVGHRPVDKPTEFRLVVFVVPESEADLRFGKAAFARSAYEGVCEGNNCREVTTALYVRASSASDRPVLNQALAVALGLELPVEQRPMPIPPTPVPAP